MPKEKQYSFGGLFQDFHTTESPEQFLPIRGSYFSTDCHLQIDRKDRKRNTEWGRAQRDFKEEKEAGQ